jgi:hypothetical protein
MKVGLSDYFPMKERRRFTEEFCEDILLEVGVTRVVKVRSFWNPSWLSGEAIFVARAIEEINIVIAAFLSKYSAEILTMEIKRYIDSQANCLTVRFWYHEFG